MKDYEPFKALAHAHHAHIAALSEATKATMKVTESIEELEALKDELKIKKKASAIRHEVDVEGLYDEFVKANPSLQVVTGGSQVHFVMACAMEAYGPFKELAQAHATAMALASEDMNTKMQAANSVEELQALNNEMKSKLEALTIRHKGAVTALYCKFVKEDPSLQVLDFPEEERPGGHPDGSRMHAENPKWSDPITFKVVKVDAAVEVDAGGVAKAGAVAKAGDWKAMGTLACVGVDEDHDTFDHRFRNAAADDDKELADRIKDRAVSVVELPAKAQLIDELAGKLFIRNRYYPYIAATIEAAFHNPPMPLGRLCGGRHIITAQPGIGKSVGVGNYLVHYFAGKFADVPSAAIVVRSLTHFHIIHKGVIESLETALGAAYSTSLANENRERLLVRIKSHAYTEVKNVLLIHDVKTSKHTVIGDVGLFYDSGLEIYLARRFSSVTSVQLASPGGVNDAGKDSLVMRSTMVLPAWSFDELESLQAQYPKTVTIGGNEEPFYTYGYSLFGGILRTRVEKLTDDKSVAVYQSFLREKKNATDYFDFDTFATSSQLNPKVPSSVALVVPNRTFTINAPNLDFVSDEVLVFCRPTAQSDVDKYWSSRMRTAATASEQGSILESLTKSKLLLWRESVSTLPKSSFPEFPCDYMLFNNTKPQKLSIDKGPFEHIVMHVAKDGKEFADMPARCDAALSACGTAPNGGGSVLVTFSNPNTPAIDFALLTRAAKDKAWSVYLFQCTVSSSHPFPKAAADVLESLFKKNKKMGLKALVWVGRKNDNEEIGVTAEQCDKEGKLRFAGKQGSMIFNI